MFSYVPYDVRYIFRHPFFKYQFPLYLYIAGIFVLSSVPPQSMPKVETSLSIDKLAHFVEYGIFSFLLFRMVSNYNNRVLARWSAILVILSSAVLGAIDESYQHLTGREPSIYDWISDCLGALAVLCCVFVYSRFHRHIKAEGR